MGRSHFREWKSKLEALDCIEMLGENLWKIKVKDVFCGFLWLKKSGVRVRLSKKQSLREKGEIFSRRASPSSEKIMYYQLYIKLPHAQTSRHQLQFMFVEILITKVGRLI